jgi:hypothetical protein
MQKIIDVPEINLALSQLKSKFDEFDTSDLYDKYLQFVSSVSEWRITANGSYFSPLPYFEEIIVGETPKLIKRKYKNIDEARWLGKYCCGYIDKKCVIEILPTHRNVDTLLVSFFSETNNTLEECHVNFKSLSNPERISVTLLSLSKCISLSHDKRALVGVSGKGNFSVFLYTFAEDGKPVHVRAATKGYPEWDYYFHYRFDGEMYRISTDELGKFIYWEKK